MPTSSKSKTAPKPAEKQPAEKAAPALAGRPLKKGDHVFLVDGSGYIFRAYHALPPLTRKSDGLQVNAVLGFCNMLWKLLAEMPKDNKPTHLAVIFDKSEKTFRTDMYPEYKAHRPDLPEDLRPQFPLIRDAVRAFEIPCLEQAGYEADDLIATYARLACEAGATTSIVSSDKDLMQLVNDCVTMYDTMKDKRIGPAEVFEKFGVGPDKVIEVQALIGDSSDNVPGVPGIGVKTAAQLIGEYGDLETLLARASEIKQDKRRQTLIDNAEIARISKKLVTLDQNVPLDVPVDALAVHEPDYKTLIAFLKAMEFSTITRRVAEKSGIDFGRFRHAAGEGGKFHRLEERDQVLVVRLVHQEVVDRRVQIDMLVERDQALGDARLLGIVDQGLAALVLLDLAGARQQRFKVAIFADQLCGGLDADARHARHVVAGIADQRLDLDDFFRRHAEFLDHLVAADPLVLHGVVHDDGRADELHQILVGGDDRCRCLRLVGEPRIGRDQVVGLIAGLFEAGDVEGVHRVANERELRNEVVRRRVAVGLVFGIHFRAERLFRFVEHHREMRRPVFRLHIAQQFPQHVAEAEHGIDLQAVGFAAERRQRVIGAENVARSVDQEDVVAFLDRTRAERGCRDSFFCSFGG